MVNLQKLIQLNFQLIQWSNIITIKWNRKQLENAKILAQNHTQTD